MGIFAKIFGSTKTIDNGLNLIDKAFFTDEEKAKVKLELLKGFEPFKLAQRFIAFTMLANYTLAFMICIIFILAGKDYQPFLELAHSFGIWQIIGLIMTWYFGGGLVDSIKRKSQ